MAFERLRDALKRFPDDESGKGKEVSADEMVGALRATLTAMTVYAGAPSGATAAEPHPMPHVEQQVRAELFSKHDFELLAKNVFFEASLEGPTGQLAVAQVTFARLASGRWGKTIQEVVYASRQFSWTANERKLNGPELKGVQQVANVFASRFKGKTTEQIVRELSAITGLPSETQYYKRKDWDESDPNETRMTERTKGVFQSLVWVADVGNHAFYIDPPTVLATAQRR